MSTSTHTYVPKTCLSLLHLDAIFSASLQYSKLICKICEFMKIINNTFEQYCSHSVTDMTVLCGLGNITPQVVQLEQFCTTIYKITVVRDDEM